MLVLIINFKSPNTTRKKLILKTNLLVSKMIKLVTNLIRN